MFTRPSFSLWWLSLFCLSFVLLLTAAPMSAQASGKPRVAVDDYLLQPSDMLKVQVFQEPDLERDVRISRNYTVTLPLIGTVNLKGKTARGAEKLITSLYQDDFLVSPQVNLTVIEYSPHLVNVLGAVNAPSSVPIPPEMKLTLLDAISRCGGFSRLANRTRIVVTRTFSDGQTENYLIDGDKIMTGTAGNRWVLRQGDVIFVPESLL